MSAPRADIGLIGGSGLYALAGLTDAREVSVSTPFGAPSDALFLGIIGDRAVALQRYLHAVQPAATEQA